MAMSDAGFAIDDSGVAKYNGIPLKADQPLPGSTEQPPNTPNTLI